MPAPFSRSSGLPAFRRRLFRPAVLLIALGLFIGACAGGPAAFRNRFSGIKAKHFKNYTFDRNTVLSERITAAPDFVLRFWSREDGRPYANYDLSAEEARIVRQCIDNIPEIHKKVLKDRLLGIYFIENFLGSGLADYVLDEKGGVYTILMFNPAVLRMNLSEIVTRKENTCFIKDLENRTIEIEIDEDIPGLFYILLHEATHILDYVHRYTPYVEPMMREIQGRSARKTLFSDRLWADYDRFRSDIVFEYKDRITFYGMNKGPKINISAAADVYRDMESLPVASLYSVFNWAEDFAEYVTFFYLTQKLGTDYTITVSDNGTVLYRYQPFANRQVLERGWDMEATLLQELD